MNVNYTNLFDFRPIPTITVANDYWENKKWRFNVPEITVGAGATPQPIDVTIKGIGALTLVNAIDEGLLSLTLFGGTEQRNLPSGYTQIEYLESSGTQYIDTGYAPNANTEVKINFSTTTLPSKDAYMFHSSDGGNARISLAIKQGLAFFGGDLTSSDDRITLPTFIANTAYDITVNKDKTIVNGTGYNFSHTSVTLPTMYSMGLFGSRTGDLKCQGRVKSFSCNENNVLKINLIPCRRNSDNVLGMYDTVTGNFLTNAGTGTFTAGADVVVPSPTNPMDIVCNNGVVKVNRNLYATEYHDKTLSQSDGVTTSTNSGVNVSAMVDCINVKSFMITSADPKGSYRLFKYRPDRTFINSTTVASVGQVLTLPSDCGYFRIQYVYAGTGTENILIYNSAHNLGIYADGTTETVEITGKNLFDISKSALGGLSSVDGSETSNTVRVRTDFVGINNSSITVSIDANDNYGITNSYYYDENKNYIGYVSPIGTATATKNETFTVPNGSRYVRVTFCKYASPSTNINLTTFKQSKIQIEQGSTATTYEPYFNGGTATAQNLFKVGTYQDVQSVIDGGVTRNVGVKVLDGTETWGASGVYVGSCFAPVANIFDDLPVNGGTAYCTHFGYSSATQYSIGKFNISTTLAIWKDSTTTPTSLKQWLADQYNAGTPVIILYPLATPTTETVTAQPMNIQAGTNIVQITQASMDDLELEVKYKAGVTVTITEIENAQLDDNVEVTIQ